MQNFLPRRILNWASVLLILGTSAMAQTTQAFQEAQRHGEDRRGTSLHWTFNWHGKPVDISSSGAGTVGDEDFQVPLNNTRLTSRLQYAEYNGDLLVLVEETDEESYAGKLVRFAESTMKPKWNCDIPGRNVGPGLVEGKSAYLSARNTTMKVNLETGKWDWRKTYLNRTNDSTAGRFSAFGMPSVNGGMVTFPETSNDNNTPLGSITFNKADGDIVKLK